MCVQSNGLTHQDASAFSLTARSRFLPQKPIARAPISISQIYLGHLQLPVADVEHVAGRDADEVHVDAAPRCEVDVGSVAVEDTWRRRRCGPTTDRRY